MVKAIRVHQPGGPEVLSWEDFDPGPPGEGEARVRHTAVGLNYIDVYHRKGSYSGALPFTPGMEGAGVVVALGEGAEGVKVGDRVAYASLPVGAYAEERNIPAQRLLRMPDWLDDRRAAAMMLQGMTAQYLLKRTFRVSPGDTILIHAAAGGVGLIVCQWANALGARVIGTVGSKDKAALAEAHGCHHPVLYKEEDLVARVKEITGGQGVPVVYDSVGRDTFGKSLDCLKPMGMMVLFGASSGSVPPFDLSTLAAKGSLFVTRPTLMTYTAERADLEASARELFEIVEAGKVEIAVNQTFPLSQGADAHRALEGRRTTGSTILIP